MKLKYYLRGLGTGILVSTIILMISFQGRTTELSDDEIIARAKSLGMEMASLKADDTIPKGTEADTETEEAAPTDTQKQKETELSTELNTEKNTEVNNKDSEKIQKDTEKNPDTETTEQNDSGNVSDTEKNLNTDIPPVIPADSESSTQADLPENNAQIDNTADTSADSKKPKKKVAFTVNRGETSRIVAEHLFEAGLVDDAEKFNTYLTENNYDNHIMPGTVQIPEGAGYKKIAKILTTKQ